MVEGTARELRVALQQCRPALWALLAQSCALNVLALAGSIYMMLVYDMVIPSRNGASLAGLMIILVVAYAFQATFEGLRSKTTRQAANSFGQRLEPRIAELSRDAAISGVRTTDPIRDLDTIRGYASGSGPAAILDLPWMLLLMAILFLLHVWLGLATLIGAIVLGLITYVTERAISKPSKMVEAAHAARAVALEERRKAAVTLRALGMDARIDKRLADVSGAGQRLGEKLQSLTAKLAGTSRTARMLLQSVVLTVGAILVINDKASGGVIFASSILSGRALAPVDAVIGQWRSLTSARHAWLRLSQGLIARPERDRRMALPKPVKALSVENLSSGPPDLKKPTIANVSFKVGAGHSVGLIGSSASGKSTLLRALAGVWPSMEGTVRLDTASLDQWDADELGAHLGYLAQDVQLIDGSIAENICRLDPDMTPELVVAAAQAAGCHEVILRLPEGYAYKINDNGRSLSAGQRQRIGLARALYRDPFLVLLDEPNSNLDPEGEQALAKAILSIRQRKGICIVAAHRITALGACDLMMVMADGEVKAFGPRDKILRPAGSTGNIRAVSENDA